MLNSVFQFYFALFGIYFLWFITTQIQLVTLRPHKGDLSVGFSYKMFRNISLLFSQVSHTGSDVSAFKRDIFFFTDETFWSVNQFFCLLTPLVAFFPPQLPAQTWGIYLFVNNLCIWCYTLFTKCIYRWRQIKELGSVKG